MQGHIESAFFLLLLLSIIIEIIVFKMLNVNQTGFDDIFVVIKLIQMLSWLFVSFSISTNFFLFEKFPTASISIIIRIIILCFICVYRKHTNEGIVRNLTFNIGYNRKFKRRKKKKIKTSKMRRGKKNNWVKEPNHPISPVLQL